MTRVAAARRSIPDEGLLLCERCGYVVTGLPPGSRCPECGTDAADSDPARRHLPAWEDPADSRPEILRFFLTTLAVTFRPTHFYRTLATRSAARGAYTFAVLHWGLAASLLGAAVFLHVRTFDQFPSFTGRRSLFVAFLLVFCVYFVFELTTSLAARLTHWEASYRGLRMPLPVVLRCLYYHAAHYVPVALLASLTVLGYYCLTAANLLPATAGVIYLYILCAEVVLAAAYLFKTYWAGMRNVMYANA